MLSGGGGLNDFYYGAVDGGVFERAEPVVASGSFDWLTGDESVYDAGGAGVYRLATYRLGSAGPAYITRYEYFHAPRVSRISRLLTYRSQSERDDGRWEHGFVVARAAGRESETLVKITTGDFDDPLAEAYEDVDAQSATIPAMLAIEGGGNQALIAIRGRIYRTETPQ